MNLNVMFVATRPTNEYPLFDEKCDCDVPSVK